MHAPKRPESHMQRTARTPSLRIHTSQLRSMSHDSEATPRSSSVQYVTHALTRPNSSTSHALSRPSSRVASPQSAHMPSRSPPMRPRSLSRTAAFAAQSLVGALARSFSPTAPHETATLLFDAPASMSPQPLLDEDVRRVFSPPPHRSSPMARVHELSIPMEQLVAPQARHGAVYLHDARPRRRRRHKAPQVPPSQAFLACMRRFVGLLALLVRPRELMTQVHTAVRSHVHAWDEAFRDAATHQRCWWPEWLAAYVPLLIWVGVSVLSTALVMTFHTQVFHALHALSLYLRGLGLLGRVLFGCMVFVTTFPPLPLYSTLIVLSGFAFGVWQGFIISYIAALSGAAVVFVLSRTWLRPWMVRLLMHAGPLKRVVRAIERQPRLLFLVRLAPYPYNLLNTLLASSHVLTLPTYLLCTAVALPKLLVHTSLGASIENFATYRASGTQTQATRADQLRQLAGGAGLVLCVALLLYLYSVARDAVDSLDDDSDDTLDDEEDTEPLRHTACSPTGPLPQHRGTPSDTRVASWTWREAPPPPLLGAVANLERAAEDHMN